MRRFGNGIIIHFHVSRVYTDTWLKGSIATPLSLSLPVTEKTHKGEKIYNYFDNLLPDSMDIRKRIQTQLAAKTNQPFDLLSHIGRDCVGPLQLLSKKVEVNVKKLLAALLLSKKLRMNLKNTEAYP